MNLLKRLFCKHERLEVISWIYLYAQFEPGPSAILIEGKCEKCGKHMYLNWPVEFAEEVVKFMEESLNVQTFIEKTRGE